MPKKKQNGVDLIAAERARHKAKGWTAEHDARHFDGSLGTAGAIYALWAACVHHNIPWPFTDGDKRDGLTHETPHRVKMLAKAGSFIAAEIDRLLRSGDSNV